MKLKLQESVHDGKLDHVEVETTYDPAKPEASLVLTHHDMVVSVEGTQNIRDLAAVLIRMADTIESMAFKGLQHGGPSPMGAQTAI